MEKKFYVGVEYETIREHKVWIGRCNENSDKNLMLAIANVVFEEKGKFVKIQRTWFEEKGKFEKIQRTWFEEK